MFANPERIWIGESPYDYTPVFKKYQGLGGRLVRSFWKDYAQWMGHCLHKSCDLRTEVRVFLKFELIGGADNIDPGGYCCSPDQQ